MCDAILALGMCDKLKTDVAVGLQSVELVGKADAARVAQYHTEREVEASAGQRD